jgi:hypothetical protein
MSGETTIRREARQTIQAKSHPGGRRFESAPAFLYLYEFSA